MNPIPLALLVMIVTVSYGAYLTYKIYRFMQELRHVDE